MVIAIITVIVGTVSLLSLPMEQYPNITPPVVEVRATYTGANAVSVEQSVASTYYRLLDFRQRLQISRKTLQSRLKTLDIIQQRFDKGIVPELDLNQAQIQKEIAAASIPQFERQVAQSENALSILLGQLPAEIPIGKGLEAQVAPPEIPVGLPATLLERRPDVAEAFYLLQAQTEQIGVAEALRLPAVSLNGLVGLAGVPARGRLLEELGTAEVRIDGEPVGTTPLILRRAVKASA